MTRVFSHVEVSRHFTSWGRSFEDMEQACRGATKEELTLGTLLRIATSLEKLADKYVDEPRREQNEKEWEERSEKHTKIQKAADAFLGEQAPWLPHFPYNIRASLWGSAWDVVKRDDGYARDEWVADVEAVLSATDSVRRLRNIGRARSREFVEWCQTDEGRKVIEDARLSWAEKQGESEEEP